MRADQVAGDVDGFGAGRTASEIGMRLAHGLAVSTGELRFGEAFDRQTEKLAGWLPATDARDCGFFPDFFAAATLPFGFGFDPARTASARPSSPTGKTIHLPSSNFTIAYLSLHARKNCLYLPK